MTPRKVLIGVVVLVVLAGGLFLVLRKDGGIPLGGKKEEPPPRAKFAANEVRGIDPQDRPEAASKASEVAGSVGGRLSRMYTLAFLRPQRWHGEDDDPDTKDPIDSIARYFVDEARGSVESNLGALALTDLGPELERVVPTAQEITKVSVLVEPDLSAPYALATVRFEARGRAKDDDANPVKIVHTATYWFALVQEGRYRIMAYSAELKADSPETKETKEGAFGELPEESLL